MVGLYWSEGPWLRRDSEDKEIESWLEDEQQLAELGRRAVLVMLGLTHRPPVEMTHEVVPLELLLRELLAWDWLRLRG